MKFLQASATSASLAMLLHDDMDMQDMVEGQIETSHGNSRNEMNINKIKQISKCTMSLWKLMILMEREASLGCQLFPGCQERRFEISMES